MIDLISLLFLAFIFLVVVLVATLVLAAGFLFAGGLLSNWFSLTRLEATTIALVVGFMLVYLLVRLLQFPRSFPYVYEGFEEAEEPEPPGRSQNRRSRRKR